MENRAQALRAISKKLEGGEEQELRKLFRGAFHTETYPPPEKLLSEARERRRARAQRQKAVLLLAAALALVVGGASLYGLLGGGTTPSEGERRLPAENGDKQLAKDQELLLSGPKGDDKAIAVEDSVLRLEKNGETRTVVQLQGIVRYEVELAARETFTVTLPGGEAGEVLTVTATGEMEGTTPVVFVVTSSAFANAEGVLLRVKVESGQVQLGLLPLWAGTCGEQRSGEAPVPAVCPASSTEPTQESSSHAPSGDLIGEPGELGRKALEEFKNP